MKIETMRNVPLTRSEFERNIYFVVERLKNRLDHIHTAQGDSLLKIRKLPNKRIDFLTVNESARLHANHIASMMNMDFRKFIKDEE